MSRHKTPCTIYIWSNNGHTPITGRGGAFCDQLLCEHTDVAGPAEAKRLLEDRLRTTPDACSGAYQLPEWWNQNQRDRRMHRADVGTPNA